MAADEIAGRRLRLGMLRSLRDEELPPELRLTVKSFIDAKCHN